MWICDLILSFPSFSLFLILKLEFTLPFSWELM